MVPKTMLVTYLFRNPLSSEIGEEGVLICGLEQATTRDTKNRFITALKTDKVITFPKEEY